MPSGESTNHEETSTETGKQTSGAELASHLDQSPTSGLPRKSLGLVDLGEEGVGGLGDDGGSETGDETRAQVEGGGLTRGELALGLAVGTDELFLHFRK